MKIVDDALVDAHVLKYKNFKLKDGTEIQMKNKLLLDGNSIQIYTKAFDCKSLCQLQLIGRIDSGVDMTAVGQGTLGQGGASNQESTRYFYLG